MLCDFDWQPSSILSIHSTREEADEAWSEYTKMISEAKEEIVVGFENVMVIRASTMIVKKQLHKVEMKGDQIVSSISIDVPMPLYQIHRKRMMMNGKLHGVGVSYDRSGGKDHLFSCISTISIQDAEDEIRSLSSSME